MNDFVCCFQYARDAKRFYEVLPKRLEKYNLQVAPEKTNQIRFSRFHPGLKNRFEFLSFEFYWKADKAGTIRVFRRTGRKRLQTTKSHYSEFIRTHRHRRTPVLLDKLTQKLRGHYNYFGVVGIWDDLYTVYFQSSETLVNIKGLAKRCARIEGVSNEVILPIRFTAVK